MSTARQRGFTLIELLVVIAIIGILSGITFGVMKGVNERAARSQAESELAALSLALESYKQQYGDYPQAGRFGATIGSVDTDHPSSRLFNALAGVLGPKLSEISGRSFIETSRFSLHNAEDEPDPGTTNAILDPWGRPYLYAYRDNGTSTDWTRRGYVLLSVGADGKHGLTVGTDGKVSYKKETDAVDNLYANGLTPTSQP